ncbi:uncharacterized protein LOC129266549 [Lytechinus pictus]|uniref:uncharacterized protein LOC129266549 n=1 Tax=Lytechinus pictus TaxID=7653 RepID=UPI0030BA1B0E
MARYLDSRRRHSDISSLEDELRSCCTQTQWLQYNDEIESDLSKHRSLLTERRNKKICNLTKKRQRSNRFRRHTNNSDVSPHLVVNLSSSPLSQAETSLLSKGLKFCPTPPEVEQIALSQDLSTFYRRIRLKEFCLDAPPSDPEPFYKKSTWIPPKNRVPSLETYIQAVSSQVRSTDTLDTRAHDNLPREERQALSSLKNRSDIIIKPADKGSAVVVMDRNTESDNGNGKYDKIARDITEQVIKVESSVPNTTYSIWDFGGQEIYYVTHPLFLSWRALYILVIPLHLKLSDEAPRTEDLTELIGSTVRTHRTILELIHFWLMSVYTHAVPSNPNSGGNPKVLLIGTFAVERDTRFNKDEVKLNENYLKELILSQPYREQVLLKIFEFDNHHAQMKEIKEVQDRIDASIKEAPYMTDTFPVKWNTFLCEIEGNGKDTWTVKEALLTMQKSWGIKDKDELQKMLKWCHDTGHIIYHQGCDLIVLKPQFLNSIVSNIITVVDSEKMRGKLSEHYKELCKKGILHIDIIKDVWNEHKGEDAQLEDIINMMIKFDLICEIPDTKDGEVGFLLGEIRSEVDGPVERIDVVNGCMEAIFLLVQMEKMSSM